MYWCCNLIILVIRLTGMWFSSRGYQDYQVARRIQRKDGNPVLAFFFFLECELRLNL